MDASFSSGLCRNEIDDIASRIEIFMEILYHIQNNVLKDTASGTKVITPDFY